MKAFTYLESDRLELVEHKEPQPRSENILIKVVACAICGTDLRAYRYGNSHITPPRILGHEVTGIIEHVGEEVGGYDVGQSIRIAPAIGCGSCSACRSGRTNLCKSLQTIGFQYDGGFAPFMEIPPDAIRMGNVLTLPDNADMITTALAEPIACVMNGQELLNIAPGDIVVILGSGFIGCMHAELALLAGAAHIYMIEISDTRAAMARTHLDSAAIDVINPGETGAVEYIRDVTDGAGGDVVIVACSVGAAQRDALELAAPRGRISLFGGLPDPSTGYLDSNLIHYKELGVFGVHASTVAQNRKTQDLILSGELDVGRYVSRVFALDQIVDALEALSSERILKAVITP